MLDHWSARHADEKVGVEAVLEAGREGRLVDELLGDTPTASRSALLEALYAAPERAQRLGRRVAINVAPPRPWGDWISDRTGAPVGALERQLPLYARLVIPASAGAGFRQEVAADRLLHWARVQFQWSLALAESAREIHRTRLALALAERLQGGALALAGEMAVIEPGAGPGVPWQRHLQGAAVMAPPAGVAGIPLPDRLVLPAAAANSVGELVLTLREDAHARLTVLVARLIAQCESHPAWARARGLLPPDSEGQTEADPAIAGDTIDFRKPCAQSHTLWVAGRPRALRGTLRDGRQGHWSRRLPRSRLASGHARER